MAVQSIFRTRRSRRASVLARWVASSLEAERMAASAGPLRAAPMMAGYGGGVGEGIGVCGVMQIRVIAELGNR